MIGRLRLRKETVKLKSSLTMGKSMDRELFKCEVKEGKWYDQDAIIGTDFYYDRDAAEYTGTASRYFVFLHRGI